MLNYSKTIQSTRLSDGNVKTQDSSDRSSSTTFTSGSCSGFLLYKFDSCSGFFFSHQVQFPRSMFYTSGFIFRILVLHIRLSLCIVVYIFGSISRFLLYNFESCYGFLLYNSDPFQGFTLYLIWLSADPDYINSFGLWQCSINLKPFPSAYIIQITNDYC